IREGRCSEQTLITSALHDVPEMGKHASGDKQLTVIIEIQSPGIRAALPEDLELVARGVIAPDASAEPLPLAVGGARCTDVGVVSHAVSAVEPTIRPPHEGAQSVVSIFVPESIEQDLRRSGRFVLPRL